MLIQQNVNKIRMVILLKFDVFEVCHVAEIQMIDVFRQVFTSKYLPIYHLYIFSIRQYFARHFHILTKIHIGIFFQRIVSLTQ